jgi:hypothetical protein
VLVFIITITFARGLELSLTNKDVVRLYQFEGRKYFKPTSLSGAGGATPSASLFGLDDGPASPAASRLASEAAALGANVTVIMNTSTKVHQTGRVMGIE